MPQSGYGVAINPETGTFTLKKHFIDSGTTEIWYRGIRDKMPRPVKRNKKPMTSVAISEELWEMVKSKKPRRVTMDEYLTHVLEAYEYYDENYKFVENAYLNSTKKNEEYVERIQKLVKKIALLQSELGREPDLDSDLGISISSIGSEVEPSRGAAVNEIVMKCNNVVSFSHGGPIIKCDDNQSTLDSKEVIEQS